MLTRLREFCSDGETQSPCPPGADILKAQMHKENETNVSYTVLGGGMCSEKKSGKKDTAEVREGTLRAASRQRPNVQRAQPGQRPQGGNVPGAFRKQERGQQEKNE